MALFLTGTSGSGTTTGYFTDQYGAPFLLRGDTAWGLVLAAGAAGGSVTWQSDMDNYTSIRGGQGYNLVLTAAGIANSNDTNSSTSANGNTWDGVAPFTSPGVLNNTYWSRVDYLISSAAAQGMTVHLLVVDTYSLDNSSGPAAGWSSTNFTAYGTALGNRYKSAANLMWHFGQDSSGSDDGTYANILAGIQGTGDTHLVTVENYFESDNKTDFNNTLGYTTAFGTSHATADFVYSYNVGYDLIEAAWQESSPVPAYRGDGSYEGETYILQDVRGYMRNNVWWSLTSGARGYTYGRVAIWPWPTTALGVLNTNPFDNSDLPNIFNAFAALPGWHQLVPDTSSTLVTAGRGTHASHITPGSTSYQGNPPDTYVSASYTPGGALAVMYLPNAANAITVNGSVMVPGYSAVWIDPVTGARTAATIASTYSHSAANSAGQSDWVLALLAPPVATWTVP